MKYLLKSIYRNLRFRPIIHLINLLGLSVSLALVIVLSIYCFRELTTDSFHVNRDQIYLFHEKNDNVHSPGVLKDQIDLEIPGIKSAFRLTNMSKSVLQFENNEAITSDLMFADAGFLKYLTYQVIEGDLSTALNEPYSVVLKKSLAYKLFGENHALGKVIKLDHETYLTVSAVIEDPEANSCLSFSAVSSVSTYQMITNPQWFTEWKWCGFLTFLCLEKDVEPNGIAQKIIKLYPDEMEKDYPNGSITSLNNIYFSDFNKSSVSFLKRGDKSKIFIQLMTAVLVVLIALINFIHINSSIWMNRIRQMGILKVSGASRMNILIAIFSETFIIFLFALILAVIWVLITSHDIQVLTGIIVHPNMLLTTELFFISSSIILFISIIFSIVPALRISNSKVMDNLNKKIISSPLNSTIRGVMVASQFTIAVVLIAFTLLVNKQIKYGCSNIGINQENIVGFNLTPELQNKKDVIKNFLDQNPAIKNSTFTTFKPGEFVTKMSLTDRSSNEISADASFFDLMGIKLLKGRLYDNNLTSDFGKVVVNETYLKDNAIEDPLGYSFKTTRCTYEIIGVFKDFHFQSFNKPLEALMICNDGLASFCQFEIHSAHLINLKSNLDQIRKSMSKLSPSFPVEIFFLDQTIENIYQKEIQFQQTFSLFAFCAIVICAMGVLAISLFACQQRTKEIGIRKVNGAKIGEILVLLNYDFIKWVAIAFVIATPLAYFAMDKWLESFAYKTELSWWIFALAGLLALGIAMLTVSWQSWKAATRNPVEALRYE